MSEADRLAQGIAEFVEDLPPNVVDGIADRLEVVDPTAPVTSWEHALSAGVPAGARGRCRALVELVRSQHHPMGPPEMARVLRVASVVDQRRRKEQTLEVVWSGPMPPDSTLRRSEQALVETINASRSEAWLVSYVAYRVTSVRESLQAALERGVAVNLLLENRDSSQGQIDFDGLKALGDIRGRGARVLEWPLEERELGGTGKPGLLHVKACVADRCRMLVSSANLTGAAFDRNMELGLLVRGGDHPRRFTEHLEWMLREGVIRDMR